MRGIIQVVSGNSQIRVGSFFFFECASLSVQITSTGMITTEDQQSQLQNTTAYQYQHGSFGHPEFEEVMQQVFDRLTVTFFH